MKPARGPQTRFFSNYCNGIPGLANYEMPNEVCEGTVTAVPRGTAVLGRAARASHPSHGVVSSS